MTLSLVDWLSERELNAARFAEVRPKYRETWLVEAAFFAAAVRAVRGRDELLAAMDDIEDAAAVAKKRAEP